MILITFFDSRGLIHKEFVPADKTINAEHYKDVMDCLLKQIDHVRWDFHASNDWFLLHNKTPAHNVTSIFQFLAEENVIVLHYPPHSPNLALTDYFQFLKFK